MAERAFASMGYNDEQQKFQKQYLRARDVIDSRDVSAEAHQTNDGIHVTPEQAALIAAAIQASEKGAASGVATLGADGKIPATQLDLGKYATSANVATYAEMLALTAAQAKVNTFVFVADATGDPTVEEGWASYKRIATNGDASDYVKVAEGESLDINIPELEQGIGEAKAAAQNAANAASIADGKAVTAKQAADNAQGSADAAQGTADAAAAEAAKRDFAYCTSEADMATKNLRPFSLVLMKVENGPEAEE